MPLDVAGIKKALRSVKSPARALGMPSGMQDVGRALAKRRTSARDVVDAETRAERSRARKNERARERRAALAREKAELELEMNLRYPETKKGIKKLYPAGSKARPSFGKARAVDLSGGNPDYRKGWILPDGTVVTDAQMAQNLYGMDMTAIGGTRYDLSGTWETLTEEEKARIVDELGDYDWDEFWEIFYPQDTSDQAGTDLQVAVYLDLIERWTRALGRTPISMSVTG